MLSVIASRRRSNLISLGRYILVLSAGFLLFSASISFSKTKNASLAAEKVLTPVQKQALIRAYYEQAVRSFQSSDYSKAIAYWEEILKLDPVQAQPPKLIALAKDKIRQKYAGSFTIVESAYMSGKYSLALQKMNEVLEADPNNPEFKRLAGKLNTVENIFEDVTGTDKISRLVRIAITNYLKPNGDYKLMCNSVIYASQISPGNDKIRKVRDQIEKDHAEVMNSIEIIIGMNLVEQKLTASLNYIYDAKYDRSIKECIEILELEPDNVMAMKRLGSSYYALGKKNDAEKYWRNALKLNPKDDEVREFLKQ